MHVRWLIICGFLMSPVWAQASHIIGGDIFYECLGYDPATNMNSFRFVMKVYRNCNSLSMDDFSNPAPVSIYSGSGSSFDFFVTKYAPLQLPVVNIPPDVSNPCLELPPNICVEEGTYTFTADLPVIDESYHISYQRCCRNVTINNIVQPNRIGATFTIELTAEAQRQCNNSPQFNNFPPIVICANEPINFDHSATDPEGDQLVYELCAALKGGGVVGAFEPGDPTSCEGFRPDPACPPPYASVQYVQPTFNALHPLIGDPELKIDAFTGLLTGVPTALGQYVVGICVKEYRNGELLSTLQRDFQFNVASCEPIVKAIIDADEVVDDEFYYLRLCGENEATLINQSIRRSAINEQIWTFDIGGSLQTLTSWDALLSFPDTGVYYGTLALNPNSNCGDTAQIIIEVLPGLDAEYSYHFDSCVAGPMTFTDHSVSEAGQIDEWQWQFATFGSGSDQNTSFLFDAPGNHRVRLMVRDSNDCEDWEEKIIPWFPAPALVIVEPSSFDGCEPMQVVFDNLSSPIDESYDITWDFGDGNTSDDLSPVHVYQHTGIYDVSVHITSPWGCSNSAFWSDWIKVKPVPIADFSYAPDNPSNFQPEVHFTDQSIDAVEWRWDFDGESRAYIQHPVHSFQDTGLQKVELIAIQAEGCPDTVVQWIDVEPLVRYFMPNAFSPNNDDVNDLFRGNGVFEGIRNFTMSIWNRWGEQVFIAYSPHEAWNGRKNNTGQWVPNGVYVYLVTYSDSRGKKHFLKGFATLVR